MCAIVDANVAHEVFGDNRTPAGQHFYDWLARRNGGTLAVGGRLLRELNNYSQFRTIFRERVLAGKAKLVTDDEMASALDDLPNELVESNDHHVLALANARRNRNVANAHRLLLQRQDLCDG